MCRVVPPLSDLLRRFRRLGVPPGPPAAGLGVPARPGEVLAAELSPVFVLVDAIADEARALVEEAGPDAERVLAAGREEAARVRTDGARRAQQERDAVASSRRRSAQVELSRIDAEAEREVARIAEVSAARRAALAARILERVRGES